LGREVRLVSLDYKAQIMKYISTTLLILFAFMSSQAQENKLTMSSITKHTKSDEQEDRNPEHFLKKGDLTAQLGARVGGGLGLHGSFSLEYMFNDRFGIKGTYVTNNLKPSEHRWGMKSYNVDATYHFIQTRRWDVSAYAGLGYTLRYSNHGQGYFGRYGRANINGGVVGRYKIRQNFGLQVELGTRSSFGLFKTIGTSKKKSIPFKGITNY